jgi:triacylglycerol esterase/lipase EstA (alpha/beta hydrolase family)
MIEERVMKRRGSGCGLAFLVLACWAAVANPACAASYRVAPNILAGVARAASNPAQSPPGANLAVCKGLRHPYPVALVDGTFANQEDDYGALAPTLANAGYCVYTFAIGAPPGQFVQTIGPVVQSAQSLAAFIGRVRASTGASRVDLIGHSQGGLVAEYYAKLLGGARYLRDLIGLSPTTHGTTLNGLTAFASVFPGADQFLGAVCRACVDQEAGSSVVSAVDNGAIAQSGVNYTIIETRNESVVTPVGSSFIRERGVKNEYVQSSCPFDSVDHADLSYYRVVFRLVFNALSPGSASAPNCLVEFPYPA